MFLVFKYSVVGIVLLLMGILFSQIYKQTFSYKINGTSVDSIPSKGNYQVTITCENAKGIWNYNDWLLNISNITGDVSCDLEFDTISNSLKLNNYLMNMQYPQNENGLFTNEMYAATVYESADVNYTFISGSEVLNENNRYIGTTSESQISSFHQFTFNEDGNYQICYLLPASSYNDNFASVLNSIHIYNINSTTSKKVSFSSNSGNRTLKQGCYDYGSISASDFIYIENYYYDKNITFWIEKEIGEQQNSNGYRYQGKNPDNYISFNNELWRIIGVFDSSLHGHENKMLVKIIRNNSIGSIAISNSSATYYDLSLLNNLLNNDYYLGDYTENTENNCFGYSKITGTCNFKKNGIKDDFYRQMIESVTWNITDDNNNAGTIENMYFRDLSTIKTLANTKIGLMYISDYGYASPKNSCERTINMASQYYKVQGCYDQNWLFTGYHENTISKKDITYGWSISNAGASTISSDGGIAIRPVLYLKENTFLVAGNGSIDNPYQISSY